GEKPQEAAPLLKAGLWWPGNSAPSLDAMRHDWTEGAPVVAICFYRALVQSGQTQPVAALLHALRAKGLNPLPVFVSSLKDPVSIATLESIFAEAPPAVVLNATGFAVSAPGSARKPTVLEHDGAMVL
ncbi:cobaltochelatase subunit CobN, partial [Escherichia coli]|nr:cobaltochelatase subunit CobN [Escherichia coli]